MLNLFGSKKDIITLEVKLAKNDHIDCCKGLEGQENEKNKKQKSEILRNRLFEFDSIKYNE